jgi:hypothetical protein
MTNDKIAALTAIENNQNTVRTLAEAWGWTTGPSGKIMTSNNALCGGIIDVDSDGDWFAIYNNAALDQGAAESRCGFHSQDAALTYVIVHCMAFLMGCLQEWQQREM